MPRARSSDTRTRIQAAALELFATKGTQQTSLRDIAERLGVTKPALYYHFASRDELVRSLVQPMKEAFESYVDAQEAAAPVEARELLSSYFDLAYEHRQLIQLAINDLAVLQESGLAALFVNWRQRLITLLIGENPPLAQQVRGMVAFGGLSDCVVMFDHVDRDELREASVDAAYDTMRP